MVRAGQGQGTVEAGQYQGDANKYLGSPRVWEAVLSRVLDMGVHREALRNSKSRREEGRARREGIRLRRRMAQEEIC